MHSAHSHSYYEMFYLKEGMCRFYIGNEQYTIQKGMVLFIPINVTHRTFYINSPLHERISIEFTLDFTTDIIESIGLKHFKKIMFGHIFTIPDTILPAFLHNIENIQTAFNTDNIYTACYEKIYFQQLLLTLFNKCLMSDIKKCAEHITDIETIDDDIHKIMLYIENNYSKNITLAQIADMVHLNPSYFSKKFKAINGFGFKDYLNKVRINHSEKLLLETDKSITDIAFECGYINSNYFGDAFRHLNKVSPSTFRKMNGNI